MTNMTREGIADLLVSTDRTHAETLEILRRALATVAPMLAAEGVRIDRVVLEHLAPSPGQVVVVPPVTLPARTRAA